MNLFTIYGVNYSPFSNEIDYNSSMPFYRVEDDKKVGYIFTYSMITNIAIKWKQIKEKYMIDGIKVIALVQLGESIETRNNIVEQRIELSDGFVRVMPLEELFSLISEEEFDIYMKYVKKFNEDVKRLLGYRTIVVPSGSSVEELKKNIESEFRSINFDKLLSVDGLYENQIKIIKRNFWERSLYYALQGEASFAENFISSEWYYKNHVEFSILGQNAIMAGYLKSVEQLLYSIVKLSEGTGRQIKKYGFGRPQYIEYCAENKLLIDYTLGSIIGYVRHYSDLWDVNSYVKNYIIDKLISYRDKYHNAIFYADNYKKIEDIKELRTDTIYLYYLLLGSMKISDSDKARIGIVLKNKEEDKYDISYSMLEKWIDRIAGGDILLEKSSKLYFQIDRYGKQWMLLLSIVSGFDEIGFPQDIKWPYMGDELKWDNVYGIDETIERVVDLFKVYLEKGKYAGNLKSYSMISVGFKRYNKVLFER